MDKSEFEDLRTRRDILIEMSTALYDKSIAYTNLILVAGYAAFITVWANSKPYLSDCEARASMVLLLASLLFFILWEIYKMILTGAMQHGYAAAIRSSPENFWAEIEKLKAAENSILVKAMSFWPIMLAFTIIPGVLGTVILMWGLATHGMF